MKLLKQFTEFDTVFSVFIGLIVILIVFRLLCQFPSHRVVIYALWFVPDWSRNIFQRVVVFKEGLASGSTQVDVSRLT